MRASAFTIAIGSIAILTGIADIVRAFLLKDPIDEFIMTPVTIVLFLAVTSYTLFAMLRINKRNLIVSNPSLALLLLAPCMIYICIHIMLLIALAIHLT